MGQFSKNIQGRQVCSDYVIISKGDDLSYLLGPTCVGYPNVSLPHRKLCSGSPVDCPVIRKQEVGQSDRKACFAFHGFLVSRIDE